MKYTLLLAKTVFPDTNVYLSVLILGLILSIPAFASKQTIAILTPENNSQSREFSEKIAVALSKRFKVVDSYLATSVFEINKPQTPFNLTKQDSKNLGVSIGCNFFVMVKTDTLRRSTFARKEFYESFASLYLVSSRTGRLTFWKIRKFEENGELRDLKIISKDSFGKQPIDAILSVPIATPTGEIIDLKNVSTIYPLSCPQSICTQTLRFLV